MISMRTFEELRKHSHSLALYCLPCDRWGEADLDGLIQIGKGGRSVIETRFRCKDCGEIVEKQVRPPVPETGGGSVYLLALDSVPFTAGSRH